ncbi:MAG: hypothetical protein V1879_05600, partial [Pseudomonadota bacterium]
PELAPMADQLLKSAGGVDADQPPIVGGPPGGQAINVPPPALRQNTSPLFPPRATSAAMGINAGMEGGK